MPTHTCKLNGKQVSVDVEDNVRLLWVLRDLRGVTGPKYGCALNVCVGGNVFFVVGCVAAGLTEKQQRDGKILQQLFKWQNELCGPCFEIAGNNVSIGIRRSVEGLDVSEAREAILRVADAMDALFRPILRLLGR